MEEQATKEQPSNFQRLKDNLPIISIGLLLMGTVNLMVYYLYFSINILEFLDFTEVLQLQFKLFAIAVAIFFIQIAYGVWCSKMVYGNSLAGKRLNRMRLARRLRSFDEHDAKLASTKAPKKRTKRQRFYKKHKFQVWLAIIIAVGMGLESIIAYYPKSIIIFLFISAPVFCLLVFVTYEELKHDDIESGGQPAALASRFSLYKSVSISVILIYVSCIAALISAVKSVSETSSYEVTAVLDNKTLTTNQDYRYLGRTKNYIFFYTISKKQAEVYQVSAVKTMLISKGIDYSHAEEKYAQAEKVMFSAIVNWFTDVVNWFSKRLV